MKIGIGLPNPVPGVPGQRLVEWARRAEERGFAQLATIDRVAYPTHDSLATLAAAAGATSRIGLHTNILVAPVYDPVLLARTAASIDQLSGAGSASAWVSVAVRTTTSRSDATSTAGVPRTTRRSSSCTRRGAVSVAGSPHPIGPRPVNGERVPVMVGGTSDAAVRRAVTWGAGWTMGGGPPEMAQQFVPKIASAWQDAGRDGEPRIAALAYFSLGDDAEADSRTYLHDYYAFTGPYADQIADGALRTDDAIKGAVQAFEDAGITELTFDPTTTSLDQIDRLADLVLT